MVSLQALKSTVCFVPQIQKKGCVRYVKLIFSVLAQQGERNASEALQAIGAASPVNMTAFAAGKAVLISDIMFGMTIREYNQLIAPAGNAALPGLAKVCYQSI
jgi:hypothetical protein